MRFIAPFRVAGCLEILFCADHTVGGITGIVRKGRALRSASQPVLAQTSSVSQ